MGLPALTADMTQRCNPANSFLAARRGGSRGRELRGGVWFGYALAGVTVASAAAATAAAMVLTFPPGKKWRPRLLRYWNWPRSKPRCSGDGASVELAASLERSCLELGFCFLDTSCPPSNVVLDVLHCFHKTRLPSSSSSPDRIPIFCLTVSNGDCSQLPRSRRKRSASRQLLLVEMPSAIDTDGRRGELLAMYEALEGTARGKSPVTILAGRKSRGCMDDGGRRRTSSMGSLARFLCPYFGVVRVKFGTEAAFSRPQGPTNNHGFPQSPTRRCEDGGEKARLFLALGDPREGMSSPCTLTIKIETDGEAAAVLHAQDRSAPLAFHFEGMCWEGMAADANLAGTPSVWGATLRVSLGEEWGRDLAPNQFGGVFARFFHDGVRLQAGRVVSAISQLRALASLYDDSFRLRDTVRETDHADHLAPHHHQDRRRRSSSGGRRRRPSEQLPSKQNTPQKPIQRPTQMLPATILLAYDSCSTESATSGPHSVEREDEPSATVSRNASATMDGGVQTPGRSRRRSLLSTRAAGRREGGDEDVKGGEGGRSGVQVRVVELRPDRGEGSRQAERICRGFGQVVHFLETLLELSRKLPPLSPVGRFCSRMRFASTEGSFSTGGVLPSMEGSFSGSYYRRRGSAGQAQDALSSHHAARSGEARHDERVVQGEDFCLSPSRNAGARPLSSGMHDRGRRATYAVIGDLSSCARRGSAATATSSTLAGAGRHRSSWSPVGSHGVRFDRVVDGERARSEESGLSIRRLPRASASTMLAEGTTDPATAVLASEGFLSEQHRQRRSRGPSLPSVSVLVGNTFGENPGQDDEGPLGGRSGRIVEGAAVAARGGNTVSSEVKNSSRLTESKPELSRVERGELDDATARWPQRETADANGKESGLSEEELLDDIANMTGRLPQMVRTTVDVGLLRGWRGEPSVGGHEDGTGGGDVMVGALQGWKAAVDALDQSQRELLCYREMEEEASSAILGALEATMATFRGQVLVMTGRNAEWLACRAKRCRQNPQQAAKLFKEAHCAVKSVVVLAGGDGPPGARWRLSERQLLSIASHHLTPLLENLRLLVVAFDNMREEDRNEISTVEEIVNNRDWLLRIATICTSAERRTVSRHSRTALHARTTTDDEGDFSGLLNPSAYSGNYPPSTIEMAATETSPAGLRIRGRKLRQPLGRGDSLMSGRFGGGASFSSEGAATRFSDARDGTDGRSRKDSTIATTAADAGASPPTPTEPEEQDGSYLSSCASSSMSASFATA